MKNEGITTVCGGISIDDRGLVRYVNDFDFSDIKRFYQVSNHRAGFIRAWHGHKKEKKYVYVATGAAQVLTIPMEYDSHEPKKHFLSENAPKVLCIPEGYYNGFQTLTDNTNIIFYSSSTLEESLEDDYRLKWDFFNAFNCWEDDYR